MAIWPVCTFDPLLDEPVGRIIRDVDRHIMPYWRNADHSVLHVGNTTKQVVNDDKKFAVSLDVSHFKPEQLRVQLEGNELIVEGNQEVKSDNSYIKKSFVQRWTLPDDCDLEAIHTQLSDAGHLSIEAPKTGQHTRRRTIPIMAAPKNK